MRPDGWMDGRIRRSPPFPVLTPPTPLKPPLSLVTPQTPLSLVQVNGGSTADKVDFAKSLLEKDVAVDSVFSKDENIDTIGATKVSRGFFMLATFIYKIYMSVRPFACPLPSYGPVLDPPWPDLR